jgi:DNA-binding XRE family transcriptional regulator
MPTIIALEAGRYVPFLSLALRIARLFGLPIEGVFEPADA